MICFCICARDHTWDDPNTVVWCRCGRRLDPMTVTEHAEAVAQHEAVGKRLMAANGLESTHKFFKD
jgi:hypothetical protein